MFIFENLGRGPTGTTYGPASPATTPAPRGLSDSLENAFGRIVDTAATAGAAYLARQIEGSPRGAGGAASNMAPTPMRPPEPEGFMMGGYRISTAQMLLMGGGIAVAGFLAVLALRR